MVIEDISRSLPSRLVISEEDVVWVRALVLKDVNDILRTNSGKRKVRLVRENTSTGIYPRVDDDVLLGETLLSVTKELLLEGQLLSLILCCF